MEPMPISIRPAAEQDADAIARIVNQAYEVERFFVLGDRTSAMDVLGHMRKGTLFVAAEGETVVGCVQVEINGVRGSFGMLAVDRSRQGAGLGRRLIDAAERHIRDAGGRAVDIQVVNLRTDLLPRYRRLGYVDIGTAPYVHRPTIQPCHFVVMRKEL
jgi:ribosomal protein S18 acetylase RimI-like enzyme